MKGSIYVLMFLTRDIIILLYVYDGAFYEKLHTLYTLHIYQAYDFSKSLKIFFWKIIVVFTYKQREKG